MEHSLCSRCPGRNACADPCGELQALLAEVEVPLREVTTPKPEYGGDEKWPQILRPLRKVRRGKRYLTTRDKEILKRLILGQSYKVIQKEIGIERVENLYVIISRLKRKLINKFSF